MCNLILLRGIKIVLLYLVSGLPLHAHSSPADAMLTMRKLASARLAIDRCVGHPDYNSEALKSVGFLMTTHSLTSRLDRLINDIHFDAVDRMLYIGYSNIFRQLTLQENKKMENLASACDSSRLDKVKSELPVLDKSVQGMLKPAKSDVSSTLGNKSPNQ